MVILETLFFLYGFLGMCVIDEDMRKRKASEKMSHLVDCSRQFYLRLWFCLLLKIVIDVRVNLFFSFVSSFLVFYEVFLMD